MKIIVQNQADFKKAEEKVAQIFLNKEWRESYILSVELDRAGVYTIGTVETPRLHDKTIQIPIKDVKTLHISDSVNGEVIAVCLRYEKDVVWIEIPRGSFPKIHFF